MTFSISTTIVNNSGQVLYCDYLPPSGGYLAVNQEFTHLGELSSWLRRGGAGLSRSKLSETLQHHIRSGLIKIKTGPDIVLFDTTDSVSTKIQVDNGLIDLEIPAVFI